MVVFDPQTSKSHDGIIHMRTSRNNYEYHPQDIGSMRNLVLVGSSLSLRFSSSNEKGPSNWGCKLTVKPIIGKPAQFTKDNSAKMRELDTLLQTTKVKVDSPSQVTSWLNLLNQVVFLMSFLTRGLQDSELIS